MARGKIQIMNNIKSEHIMQWFFDKTRSPVKSIILTRITQLEFGLAESIPESELIKILFDKN